MPDSQEMLPKSRMNDAILAAYRAGKSAERFFERGPAAEGAAGDADRRTLRSGQETGMPASHSDWHH